jgi:hypothetical protein
LILKPNFRKPGDYLITLRVFSQKHIVAAARLSYFPVITSFQLKLRCDMDKVRFGIIGIGNIGTVHARYLLAGTVKDACLTAVCDNAPEKHPAIRQLVGNLPLFSDAQEMLQSGLIDAVIVATPHYEHPRLSMLAMRNGIHTLCEKPAGVYTAQVQEMNACARECDVVFGIMYNQRPNPLYQKVKDLIDSGELGEIRRSNWIITNWYRSQSYYNSGGWRATWKGKVAASCSTRTRISSISGSGWSECRSSARVLPVRQTS